MVLKDESARTTLDRYSDIMLQGSSLEQYVPRGLDHEEYEALMELFLDDSGVTAENVDRPETSVILQRVLKKILEVHGILYQLFPNEVQAVAQEAELARRHDFRVVTSVEDVIIDENVTKPAALKNGVRQQFAPDALRYFQTLLAKMKPGHLVVLKNDRDFSERLLIELRHFADFLIFDHLRKLDEAATAGKAPLSQSHEETMRGLNNEMNSEWNRFIFEGGKALEKTRSVDEVLEMLATSAPRHVSLATLARYQEYLAPHTSKLA